ncbi:MAG: SDR family oxidoreductase [Hyphomicrobiaceae bacterium]|nr:SDR family oxidoreductase [Hyphomicrobiaceae bacterium]
MTAPRSGFLDALFGLEGRVALVTGASNGIGRRMAEALARAGASVVLVARRAPLLEAAARDIGAAGGAAFPLPWDLLDLDGLGRLHAQASAPFGPPDILVNAAGVNLRLPAEAYTPAQWNQTIALNLSAPFFLARACVPAMRAKGFGNILNIASLQSFRAFANGIAYGASKGGVAQLTRAMAEAWSRDGIVANAVQPGFFPTELTAPVFSDPEVAGHHARMTAVGRNGELPDLDGVSVFLASRACAFITGQIIGVDGGYTAK